MDLAANHAWYKPIFYWWHEMAACCYFGVDLGNGLDHYSLSRLADGTPYSSSDLPYFTLLLYFDKNILSPKFSSLDKIISVQLPFNKNKKSSKTNPNSVLAAKPFQFYKNNLSPTFFLSYKTSLFPPSNYVLLPLESKQCPLTLASVLAYAGPVDEPRF